MGAGASNKQITCLNWMRIQFVYSVVVNAFKARLAKFWQHQARSYPRNP